MVPERRVCALCGTEYVQVVSVGSKAHANDKLCGKCLLLPLPPVAPYERPDAGDRPRRAGDEPEEPEGTTA